VFAHADSVERSLRKGSEFGLSLNADLSTNSPRDLLTRRLFARTPSMIALWPDAAACRRRDAPDTRSFTPRVSRICAAMELIF